MANTGKAEQVNQAPHCTRATSVRSEKFRPLDEALFKELADQWRKDTRFLSAVDEIAMHPAYQRIIGMGQKAVPLILRELQQRLDHWFWALESITGESPVPPEDAGKMQRMREKWLEWGHCRGLIRQA